MNLDKIQQLCEAYLQGNLSDKERKAFELHLQSLSRSTRRDLLNYSAVAESLLFAAEPVEPNPDLKNKILSQIRPAEDEDEKGTLTPETLPFLFVRSYEGQWDSVGEGVSVKVLYQDKERNTTTLLLRMAAGSEYPSHTHDAGEELLMIEGDCWCEGELLHAGDYHRAEGGSHHGVTRTEKGCLMLVIAPEIHVDE